MCQFALLYGSVVFALIHIDPLKQSTITICPCSLPMSVHTSVNRDFRASCWPYWVVGRALIFCNKVSDGASTCCPMQAVKVAEFRQMKALLD